MKVIFLDIDGVLNSDDYQAAIRSALRSKVNKGYEEYPIKQDGVIRDKYGVTFDPRCVAWLDALIQDTDSKLVISSTWRFSGLDTMCKMWSMRGLPGDIIGITPVLNTCRGDEIKHWLDNTDLDIESYIIIDDDPDMLEEQMSRFIKTDSRYGLTYIDYTESKRILNTH